ncbi:hypothetical protein Skr01_12880 [Sphaerisporangium krabiense]|nr:hypothetical protein Skr01_12880 [Sphaerisporangium krabiense]
MILVAIMVVTSVVVQAAPGHAVDYWEISARHSWKCLDVAGFGTADGTDVFQWSCTGAANQRWSLVDSGDGRTVYIRSQHSGKCLDVAGASTANGADVFQWTCLGTANQKWFLQSTSAQWFIAIAQHSGKCLDVAGSGTADGTNVFQWSCFDPRHANQEWQMAAAL